jgi:catalase
MSTAKEFSEKVVDALGEVHGVHPGFRVQHSKGFCCRGSFRAGPQAADLTVAAHMQGESVPVTVRFSNGSGSPTRHDGARDGRGMATRFHLPDGGATDIVALTLPAFFVRTPEDFLELVRAQKVDPQTRKPDIARIEAFVAEHPEAQFALGFQMFSMPPASFAQLRYFGIHAFKWTNSSGDTRFVRYRWEPEAGEASISENESRARERNYLQDELRERMAGGAVVFDLHIQIAEDDDDPADPTTPWPEERQTVSVGRLELTEPVADQQADCEALIFDPTRVTPGIECSGDRILHARPGAYSVSYDRRTSA